MSRNSIKRSIAMSEEMHALLAQVAARQGREVTEAHLIREAIRQYLDAQADVIGSRRHFQRALQQRIDHLERAITFQMHILLCLLAAIAADDGAIDDAIIAARRDGAALQQRIEAVRDLQDEP
jgi:predicted DNA-binding protein